MPKKFASGFQAWNSISEKSRLTCHFVSYLQNAQMYAKRNETKKVTKVIDVLPMIIENRFIMSILIDTNADSFLSIIFD